LLWQHIRMPYNVHGMRKIAALAPVVHRVHKEMVQTVLANSVLAGLTPAQQALAVSSFDTEDF
jgi:hypothetical protein